MDVPGRVARHVDAFNAAVRSGTWAAFGERFADDAVLSFVGVPVGPFAGREAIVAAYQQQPPTDTMTLTSVRSARGVDVVAFRWTAGGAGTMHLTWSGGRVLRLEVAFTG